MDNFQYSASHSRWSTFREYNHRATPSRFSRPFSRFLFLPVAQGNLHLGQRDGEFPHKSLLENKRQNKSMINAQQTEIVYPPLFRGSRA
jgi:hypothetical protein